MSDYVVPDLIGRPFLGYRVWRIASQRHVRHPGFGTLLPLNWPTIERVWPPGQRFHAFCARGHGHAAPAEDCTCGVYVLKHMTRMEQLLRRARRSVSVDEVSHFGSQVWFAFGFVNLWGKLVEGEYGWRAQYAYPKLIFIPTPVHVLESTAAEPDARRATALTIVMRNLYRCSVFDYTMEPKRVQFEARCKRFSR